MTRLFSVHVASGDVFDTRQFFVDERMSSLFSIQLVVLGENQDIDFDAVVGRPARFSILTEMHERSWSGICSCVQQVAVEENRQWTYELTIVPSLWFSTQRRNYRMFQQMSELDIVLKLLKEWDIEPELRLTATYARRKYRVQYGESDYAFLSRMLEEAGISFYFTHTGGDTRLVLADAPEWNEPRAAPIAFRDQPMAAPGKEHVTRVKVGRQVRPGRYTMRDHDYRKQPACKLVASAEIPEGGMESRLERYHYIPGAFLFGTDKGDDTPVADDEGKVRTCMHRAEEVARKRLEAKRASAGTCTFETNAHDIAPGVVMRILDHPKSELAPEQKLLIVGSTLRGNLHGEWRHRCDARSADAAYRPRMATPRPKANGLESATVVGPPGEDVHCDEFGRVRVHFHWDRESRMDDKSSCWIHVSQPWGGAGYGAMNLPRVGQEVLVAFLGGDPDRPMVVGRVYTNLQKVPYQLPQNKTQSGWRSQSSPGGDGFNEIRFEDAKGREQVYIRAERDLKQLVKTNEEVTIGHNSTKIVRNHQREVTGQTRNVVVGASRSTQIGAVDATIVGEMCSVRVLPPDQEGSEDATAWTMQKDKITFSTPGGAKLTLEGGTIKLEAPEMLYAFGSASCTMWSRGATTVGGIAGLTLGAPAGDVVVKGGPLVKINT
jgi:type VI secretion system secreted protein VgrG